MDVKTRIDRRLANLKAEGRAALVTFLTAGDPDFETSCELLLQLPQAGADIIELGMPFSDPMADGPAIQASSLRALQGGQTMRRTFDLVRQFRVQDEETPIVLMGYYNPIYVFPVEDFLVEAADAGVDGLIVVDVPAEADNELCIPAGEHGISFIRLVTPTTDDVRLARVLANTSGFIYYVSITGITGAAGPDIQSVGQHVTRVRAATALPIAVGFGVKEPAQAREIGALADGVVVGSALVNVLADSLDEAGRASERTVPEVVDRVRRLAQALASP